MEVLVGPDRRERFIRTGLSVGHKLTPMQRQDPPHGLKDAEQGFALARQRTVRYSGGAGDSARQAGCFPPSRSLLFPAALKLELEPKLHVASTKVSATRTFAALMPNPT